ncbi:MAG: anthranilate synthase component II [Bacteroidia bacterium]
MSLLIIDNYDSFTYNLVHLIEKAGNTSFEVHRNDKISLEEIDRFDSILLSPGPGLPSEAGMILELIKKYKTTKKIFGVCLGLQAIGEAFGGKLKNLNEVYHGLATPIHVVDKDPIFNETPEKFLVGRYHSWVLDTEGLPEELRVTSLDEQGNIMSVRHKQFNISGVQFHPESILSEYGEMIIKNWLGYN